MLDRSRSLLMPSRVMECVGVSIGMVKLIRSPEC